MNTQKRNLPKENEMCGETNSGKKDNATPLFDWGKYYEKDGKIVMPVSVQAHHSFVDGIHIGQFADRLQEYLESF